MRGPVLFYDVGMNAIRHINHINRKQEGDMYRFKDK